mgnify:CR=1 FL=1
MVFAGLLDLFDNVVVEQVDEFTHHTDSMMREHRISRYPVPN